jgi:hypothetical protein
VGCPRFNANFSTVPQGFRAFIVYKELEKIEFSSCVVFKKATSNQGWAVLSDEDELLQDWKKYK